MVMPAVTAQEHAEATHDVGQAEIQPTGIERYRAIEVRYAEHHMIDLLRTRTIEPLPMAIPARNGAEIVFLRCMRARRLSQKFPEPDTHSGVVAAVRRAVRIDLDGPVAPELCRDGIERFLRVNAPNDLARTGFRQEWRR